MNARHRHHCTVRTWPVLLGFILVQGKVLRPNGTFCKVNTHTHTHVRAFPLVVIRLCELQRSDTKPEASDSLSAAHHNCLIKVL
jgi:hypothetical protein